MATNSHSFDIKVDNIVNGFIKSEKSSTGEIMSLVKKDQSAESKISFSIPIIGISRFWHPNYEKGFYFPNFWEDSAETRINLSMPIFVFFDETGTVKLNVSLSEAMYTVVSQINVNEEERRFELTFIIPEKLYNEELKIRFDLEQKEFSKSIIESRDWMFETLSLDKNVINQFALDDVYSTWYSYHQNVNETKLLSQLDQLADYSLKTIILDDGWQTDDSSRRYAYSGDWEVSQKKFPNLKSHIKQFQDRGINYLLWVTLPYVGKKTESFTTFKDRLLYFDQYQKAGILDPRYPEVRKYLIDKLVFLVGEYDLDGLKIDFIDSFKLENNYVSADMDTVYLEEALYFLIRDINIQTKKIKSDFLIEYREDYFGPFMGNYGDIIRAKDCPNDFVRNRFSVVKLRLLCPNMIVHSDMIMFNEKDTLEYVAFQLLNCLYASIQISVDLNTLTNEQDKMIKHWMKYKETHKELLLCSELTALNPQNNFDLLSVENNDKKIVTSYQEEKIINLETTTSSIDIINASSSNILYLKLSEPNKKSYVISTYNMYGELISSDTQVLNQLHIFEIPIAGYISLEEIS